MVGRARRVGEGKRGKGDGEGRCETGCAGVFVGDVVGEVGEAKEAGGSIARGIDLGD